MRILITGASGLLGGALVRALCDAHELTLWSFVDASEPYVRVDVRDAAAVAAAVRTATPDVVIHAAANRDPDFCEAEPAEARAMNVQGTRSVLDGAVEASARFVLISTDYVFDGASPPYAEDAVVGPINVYGETKVEAEALVRKVADHLIVRIPVLYGRGARTGNDLIAKLRAVVDSTEPVEVDDLCKRTPTLTDDVAAAIAFLLDRKGQGTFHIGSGQVLTQHTMAQTLARVLGASPDRLRSGAAPPKPAQRPVAALLDTGRLRSLGFDDYTSFEDGVRRLVGG